MGVRRFCLTARDRGACRPSTRSDDTGHSEKKVVSQVCRIVSDREVKATGRKGRRKLSQRPAHRDEQKEPFRLRGLRKPGVATRGHCLGLNQTGVACRPRTRPNSYGLSESKARNVAHRGTQEPRGGKRAGGKQRELRKVQLGRCSRCGSLVSHPGGSVWAWIRQG